MKTFINNIILNLIMFLCHIQHKKVKQQIMYIKGTGKQYPSYMIYTEDKNIYKRMDEF